MSQTPNARQTADGQHAGSPALDRLQASIDAAETALKDLRTELSRDSRDLLNDLGKTLRDARRNLARTRRRVLKDLEQIPHAVIQGKPARRPSTSRVTSARAGSSRSRTRSTSTRRKTTTSATGS